MQAIIFANRNGHEITPLDKHYCPALLPIANKAVIEYTLDSLKQSGIRHAKIVVANDAGKIQQHLQQGQRWGVKLDYFLSKPQESVESVLRRMQCQLDEPLLIIRGDMLRTATLTQYIELCEHMPQTYIGARMNGMNPGLLMLPAGINHTQQLDWPLVNEPVSVKSGVSQLLHGECFHLLDFENIIKANQYVMTHPLNFALSGRQINPHKNQWFEHQVNNESVQHFNGSVGAFSHIDALATLTETVVIGEHCYIGASTLSNTVVLPNTSVGSGLNMHNMIVAGDTLINALTNQVTVIDDPSIISVSGLQQSSTANTTPLHQPSMLGQQVLAVALMIVSLPIILMSFLSAFFSGKNIFGRRLTVKANDQCAIELVELNTNHALINRLPQLSHVISGKLHLLGAAPIEIKPRLNLVNETQQDTSANAIDKKFGVFGPVQLFLNSAPQEEITLIEMEYSLLSQWDYARRLLTLK
ncbi:sugar phosphate nucleotidyltransferase [Shewanella intestini]|uniref:Translation initiation factor eIF2B subunit gamma n=1 Tax=Shewanella intestini TaxID=2017544 RepID=A0ABS5I0I2_9GAMM|nr:MULTISPECIES: sugar phosphate nucleotidyltransferase [Shewanella]MBR9726815.1 hypothetical protein [Shewanella intestini]MRG34619.1 hypothetical protein [Shewanella sp. XMDDZSB0408]